MFFDFFHYVSDLESMLTLKKIKKPCFFVFWLYILRLSCKKQKKTLKGSSIFQISKQKNKKVSRKTKKSKPELQTKSSAKSFCFFVFFFGFATPSAFNMCNPDWF